jgi:hypothetical protein
MLLFLGGGRRGGNFRLSVFDVFIHVPNRLPRLFCLWNAPLASMTYLKWNHRKSRFIPFYEPEALIILGNVSILALDFLTCATNKCNNLSRNNKIAFWF